MHNFISKPDPKSIQNKEQNTVLIVANSKDSSIYINDEISWQAKLFNYVVLKGLVKKQMTRVTKDGVNVKSFRAIAKTFDKLATNKLQKQRLSSNLQSANQHKSIQVSSRRIANITCRYLQTSISSERIILYFHGGGFCIHLPKTYEGFVSKLALRLNANAFIPDYHLAPEHLFPASVNDCFNVYKRLLELGYKAENIILAGDSAGGNLTLTTLIQIRDSNIKPPAAAILMSPATDVSNYGFELMAENQGKDPIFEAQTLKALTENYISSDESVEHKLVSPLFDSLHGLPPLQFHAGSTELLLNNSVRANEKANKAGTSSEVIVWNEMPHVHPLFTWLPESNRAITMMVDFADKHLN